MRFAIEVEQEEDARWIAEVSDLPGVLACGASAAEAKARVQALALRVVADRLEHGEAGPDFLLTITFANDPGKSVPGGRMRCSAASRSASA